MLIVKRCSQQPGGTELNGKKKVYYEGFETGKLNMDLVSERLEQLKEDLKDREKEV